MDRFEDVHADDLCAASENMVDSFDLQPKWGWQSQQPRSMTVYTNHKRGLSRPGLTWEDERWMPQHTSWWNKGRGMAFYPNGTHMFRPGGGYPGRSRGGGFKNVSYQPMQPQEEVCLSNRVNCKGEDDWEGNVYLPKYENHLYDESAKTLSVAYLVGYFDSISFPICLDTGAGKSLMSSETFKRINHEGLLQLEPQHRDFGAINGSRIPCQGSIIIKLMLMGEKKNYVGFFEFFIVKSLAVDALIGVNEIYRHGIRVNANEGFACHDKVGRLICNMIFKFPYDMGLIGLSKSRYSNSTKAVENKANLTDEMKEVP